MSLDHLPQPTKRYQVRVADNWYTGDWDRSEEETRIDGEFELYDDAVAACMNIVDESLQHCLKTQKCGTAKELFDSYISGGSDPYIYPVRDEPEFSAWDYAEIKSKEILPD